MWFECLHSPKLSIPENPTELILGSHPEAEDKRTAHRKKTGENAISASDRWALGQLSANGEEIVGVCQYPQYLLLARTILMQPLGENLWHLSIRHVVIDHIWQQNDWSSINLEIWAGLVCVQQDTVKNVCVLSSCKLSSVSINGTG